MHGETGPVISKPVQSTAPVGFYLHLLLSSTAIRETSGKVSEADVRADLRDQDNGCHHKNDELNLANMSLVFTDIKAPIKYLAINIRRNDGFIHFSLYFD